MRPGRDDKILASWNGLMIRGVAEAARAFGSSAHRELAIRAGEFLFASRVRDGRVFRSIRGKDPIPGFLEDQAAVGLAALSLYELTFDDKWLDGARTVAASMVDAFWDEATSQFFDTAHDHERLIVRPHDVTDNAMPSGNSLAADLLARIGILTGDAEATRRASQAVDPLAELMARHPLGFGHLLGVADMLVNGSVELALVGDVGSREFSALAAAAGEVYAPALIIAGGSSPSGTALLANRPLVDGRATAYVCRGFTCDAPDDERGRRFAGPNCAGPASGESGDDLRARAFLVDESRSSSRSSAAPSR